MLTGPKRESSGCQEFREELEALPLKENGGSELRTVLERCRPRHESMAEGASSAAK